MEDSPKHDAGEKELNAKDLLSCDSQLDTVDRPVGIEVRSVAVLGTESSVPHPALLRGGTRGLSKVPVTCLVLVLRCVHSENSVCPILTFVYFSVGFL